MEKLLLVYDFVDTATDLKLVVDLFKGSNYGWGTISVLSVMFGIGNLFVSFACLLSNSVLEKFPCLKSITIKKKNLIIGSFGVSIAPEYFISIAPQLTREDAVVQRSPDRKIDSVKVISRSENLVFYLCIFKLPEDVPAAAVRLFQYDLEKDALFTIGSLTTIISLCATVAMIISFACVVSSSMERGPFCLWLYGTLFVAVVFFVTIIIFSCLAISSIVVLSLTIRIIFDIVLILLAFVSVFLGYHFLTAEENGLDHRETYLDLFDYFMICWCAKKVKLHFTAEAKGIDLDSL